MVDVQFDRVALSKSYYEFFKAAWHIVEPKQQLVDNWHIRFICWRLQQEVEAIERGELRKKHLIINIPPRSGKSYLVAVMLNAWVWTRSPHMKFMTSSFSGTLSSDHAVATKKITSSAWYQQRWGHEFRMSKHVNRNNHFVNDKGGHRIATSVNGGSTGMGCNIVIADDLIDPRRSVSKAEREKANDHATKTLFQRLNNPDVDLMIVVQQRLHEKDPAGALMEENPDMWDMIVIPAEDRFPVKPVGLKRYYTDGLFDPLRFPLRVLVSKQKVLGSRGYAEQFGQQPSDPSGNTFKRDWFRFINMDEFQREVMTKGAVIRFCADTAYDDEDKIRNNDPSGIMAYVHFNNLLYIIAYEQIYADITKLYPLFESFCRANGYTSRSLLKIEPAASGKDVENTIRAYTKINVTASKPPAGAKEVRAENKAPFVESKRVVLVRARWNKDFVDEVCTFPNAAHDESVDCLVMAIDDAEVKKKKGPRVGAGSRR